MINESDNKVKESTIVRGICASVQAMKFPMVENIIELFKENGYQLKLISKPKENDTTKTKPK